MAFEQTVEQGHKLTYANNALMVAQQMRNPLREAITIRPASGEAMRAADLLGKKKAQRGSDYARNNPDNRSNRSARWLVRPEVIHDGEIIDTIDKFDMAMDPTSELVRNSIMAVEREIADVMMGIEETAPGVFEVNGSGILGNAVSGKRPTTVTGLPSGNYVPHGGVGLNLDKLRDTLKALRKAEFGMEAQDQLYAAITATQMDDLLQLAVDAGQSLNAFTISQLQNGRPTPIMGVTWIFTNRLPKDANGNRLVPVWSKTNIVAGMWQDVQSRIWNNTDKQNLPYIYTDAYVDCVRLQDAGVIVIECVEA